MNKIKALKPSLRENKRYLAFEILSDVKIKDFSQVRDSLQDALTGYVGAQGSSQAGIIVLKERYDNKKQRGIIRVNHNHVDELKASLCFIENIDGNKVIVKSLGVSGILKKSQEKYLAN